MNEFNLIGTLLPTSPDFFPIVQEFRNKYNLPEVNPDLDDPIEEIYLGNETIPLEKFRQEIQDRLEGDPIFMPNELGGFYNQAKALYGKPLEIQEFDLLPEEIKSSMVAVNALVQTMMENLLKVGGQYFSSLTRMLYIYILAGETEEIPKHWISAVAPIEIMGEKVVVAFASQAANPDAIVQQFRDTYAKTFGRRQPKITEMMVSTAYYMQLQRAGKKWDYIVAEYIRRNKFRLPRDKNTKRYFDVWTKYSQRLKKRIQRSEKTLSIVLRDIK